MREAILAPGAVESETSHQRNETSDVTENQQSADCACAFGNSGAVPKTTNEKIGGNDD